MALIGWGARRKFLYTAVGGVLVIILALAAWRAIFVQTPLCTDGRQNGDEHGVDCGGSCSLVCSNEARAPLVMWARSFESAPHLYTAVAYIQNNNAAAGARRVAYSFQLLDAQNNLVVEHDGETDLPPVTTIPIIDTNIDVGNQTVARTLFAFSEVPVWQKLTTPIPQIKVSGEELSPDGSRLSATITNNSTQNAGPLTITAVLFDATDTARAASKSVLGSLARGASKPVVFSWSGGVAGVIRAEITVLPAF